MPLHSFPYNIVQDSSSTCYLGRQHDAPTPKKDAHTLITRACENVALSSKRDFAGVIKRMNFWKKKKKEYEFWGKVIILDYPTGHNLIMLDFKITGVLSCRVNMAERKKREAFWL